MYIKNPLKVNELLYWLKNNLRTINKKTMKYVVQEGEIRHLGKNLLP